MAVSKRQLRISDADREQRSLGLAQVHEWDSHGPRAFSPAGDASRMGPEHSGISRIRDRGAQSVASLPK